MTKTIVVLGAGHGGVHLSHYMLSLKAQFPDLKVIMVSPTEEFYWNLASIRVVLPAILRIDDTFRSIPKAFSKYPADTFELILGTAEHIDAGNDSVTVRLNSGKTKAVHYHTLIIATGSRAKEHLPWKSLETSEKTREGITALRKRIETAKSIVVGGAGPTGVELAGELGAAYGKTKAITIVCPGKLPLEGLIEPTRSAALKELNKLNVTVKTETKVTKVVDSYGKRVLELTHADSSKTTLEADDFIPTYGIEYNTEYAPASWKTNNNRLRVNATQRQPEFENVFIVGDAADGQAPTAQKLMEQMTYVKKQMPLYMKGEPLADYVRSDSIGLAIATGPSGGTGQNNSWRLFSLLVWWFKSRQLGLDVFDKAVNGLNL
ncbi:FAD/NAD(P)-binding domain-containing protein [Sarocladium strictum]